jgi:hypothetical protein
MLGDGVARQFGHKPYERKPPRPGTQLDRHHGDQREPSLSLADSFAADATTGCFGLLTAEPVGGTAGFEAFGQGNPAFAAPQPNATTAAQGSITAFTITNLTPTTGNGTFTFDIGTIGTVVITGSVTETITEPLVMSRPRPAPRKR